MRNNDDRTSHREYGSFNHRRPLTIASSSDRHRYSDSHYHNDWNHRRTDTTNFYDETNFTSLCIKNLNDRMAIEDLERSVAHQFNRFGDFTIKVTSNKKGGTEVGAGERLAFVNFYRHSNAREALRHGHQRFLCGREMFIEPVLKQYSNVHSLGVASSVYNGKAATPRKVRSRSPRSRHNLSESSSKRDSAFSRPLTHSISSFSSRHRSRSPRSFLSFRRSDRHRSLSNDSARRLRTPPLSHPASSSSSYRRSDDYKLNIRQEISGERSRRSRSSSSRRRRYELNGSHRNKLMLN